MTLLNATTICVSSTTSGGAASSSIDSWSPRSSAIQVKFHKDWPWWRFVLSWNQDVTSESIGTRWIAIILRLVLLLFSFLAQRKFGKSTSFPCVSNSSSTNSSSHHDDLSQCEHDPIHHLGADPHTRLHPTMTSDTMHDHLKRDVHESHHGRDFSNTLGRPWRACLRECENGRMVALMVGDESQVAWTSWHWMESNRNETNPS
jgi:hypothetical protein